MKAKLSRREAALMRYARRRALADAKAEFEQRRLEVFVYGMLLRSVTIGQAYAMQELVGDKSPNLSVHIAGEIIRKQ